MCHRLIMNKTHVAVGVAAAAALPILLSSFYLYRLHDRVASQTTRTRGRHSSRPTDPKLPKSLPADITSAPGSSIIHYERVVSSPVPASSLNKPPPALHKSSPSALVRAYLQGCHLAFSRTPQAFLLQLFVSDADAKRTFSTEHIRTLAFRPGDRVNGVYTVSYVGEGSSEGSERVELALDPPEGYKGQAPQGRIVCEVVKTDGVEEEERVVFVNETWMWRTADEPKTLLEGGFGAWVHDVTSGWLVLEGLKSIHVRG